MDRTPGIFRLFDLLTHCDKLFSGNVAFCTRDGENWTKTTFNEYFRNSNLVSYALIHSGIEKGDRIVTISRNRVEFNCVDMGIMQTGAIHVPLYATVDDLKLEAILIETGAKIVFTGNIQMYRRVLDLKKKAPSLLRIISFDFIEDADLFSDFLRTGFQNQDSLLLENIKAGIKPADVASITYISGSTTEVKGIEHSHSDHIHNSLAISQSTCIKPGMNLLSLLPLAHSYERSINYCSQYLGVTTWYNNNFKTIGNELIEIKPDVIFMVPFLMQKLAGFLTTKAKLENETSPDTFEAAIAFARQHEVEISNQSEAAKLKLFDQLVYCKVRQLMGNNIKMLYCGGAALDQNLRRFFDTCGLTVYEGYGLTEAGPVVSHNSPQARKPDTVGKPIADTVIKIAPDGEVLIKSPSAMKNYYCHPGSLPPVDEEGWLHTGDLGEVDDEGFLKLTGLKKRIFKLSSGIYTDPLTLEKLLEASPLIKQAFVYGHNRDYLSTVIIPDKNALSEKLVLNDPVVESGIRIYRQPELIQVLALEIRAINEKIKSLDNVVSFLVADDEWTRPNNGLHDNKGLNREFLSVKYQAALDQLY